MQTDIWLTQSDQPAQCPLCSKSLKASSKTCYNCGFSLESPATGSSVWIDPAVYTYRPSEPASAHPLVVPETPPPPGMQPSEHLSKPAASVVWEGTTPAQQQSPTRQRTGSMNVSSTSKHASPTGKSVAKPVHTRRRTYTRSLSQAQDAQSSTRPAMPQPPMWQYESPNFEAGSSLPALSLIIAETPTQPGITLPELEAAGTVGSSGASTRRLPDIADIDEIDTVPPLLETHPRPGGESNVFSPSPDIRPLSGADLVPAMLGSLALPDAPSLADPLLPYAPYTHVDEIDTVPEHLAPTPMAPARGATTNRGEMLGTVVSPEIVAEPSYASVDEIDTVPEMNQAPGRALVPVMPQELGLINQAPTSTEPSSWTAGRGAQSPYARHIADRTRRKKHHFMRSLNPFDHLRWWLLRPGRIEFILWLGGTILLISITCILLLVTAFSLNWITPGLRGSITSTGVTSASPEKRVLPTITGTPGLVFTLLDKGLLLPGQSIHVRGQGFSPNGRVLFTLDGMHWTLNANGSPTFVKADTHGAFTTTLSFTFGLAWNPGPHLIIARDVLTNRLAVLSFVVVPPPFGKGATATSVPITSGATATPTPGKPGTTPTPVTTPGPGGQTPVPSPTPTVGVTPTPTPKPTPTPTQVPPTPTPTPGITPTPTVGATPTAGASPTATHTAAVPLSSTSSNDQGPRGDLSNAVGEQFIVPGVGAINHTPGWLASWLWLPMLFYILAMFMLGIAGVLHKRRR